MNIRYRIKKYLILLRFKIRMWSYAVFGINTYPTYDTFYIEDVDLAY